MRLQHVWDVTWIRFVVVRHLFIIILLRALVPLLPSSFPYYLFSPFFSGVFHLSFFYFFLPVPPRLLNLLSSFLYPCLCILSVLFRFFLFLRLLWHLPFLLWLFILLPGHNFTLQKPYCLPYFPLKPIIAHTVPYTITHPPVPDIFLGQLDSWWWDRQVVPKRQ